MHCSPMAGHPGVAARAAISFPYETRFYDVIDFFTSPCWILLDCGRLGLKCNILKSKIWIEYEVFGLQTVIFFFKIG